MRTTKIEWTDRTWNPVTGCTKVSDGCINCYAARMANRLCAMGNPRYKNNFNVTLHSDLLEQPYKLKRPTVIFVNSMSDLFHEKVPDDFIYSVFKVMNDNSHHIFQILTKRSHRLCTMNHDLSWSENIWMGVTVESNLYTDRIIDLRSTNAHVKFLSCEPLLGSIADADFSDIDWVVVGGESGPGARLMREEWVREIRDKCKQEEIAFFFKQWGGVRKRKNGRMLDNKEYNAMPHMIGDQVISTAST